MAPSSEARPASTPLAFDASALLQHWVRSTEEEQSGGAIQIYRPAGSREFPPLRFRMAYKFARGGGCDYYFLSPDDAHRFKPCKWTIGGSDPKILQVKADGSATSFRIVELSGKILRLASTEPR